MENNAIIKCANMRDENIYTVIIKYRVYRNDRGKLFGRLLVLKHKVENFLKEFVDDEILFQNPILQRTKDGLLDLFQGLTSLCSGISPSQEMLTIPDLPQSDTTDTHYEMKFVKGSSLSDLWLCYVENSEFLKLLKRLREKYDNNELESFIFYPRLGEHIYFKQGANIFRGIVQEYVIPEDCDDEERVDVKVLNIDNSDVIVLPQNCFFQLDKDGTELPAQCVLCTADEPNLEEAQNETVSSNRLSLATLKKHKLNVCFRRQKVAVAGTSISAQCVTISVCADKIKDKNNGFNVNSKEFVPRNSKPNDVQTAWASTPDSDSKSGQTTRSSSPVVDSSQEDTKKKEPAVEDAIASLSVQDNPVKGVDATVRSIEKESSDIPASVSDGTKSAVIIDAEDKGESKVNVINYANKNTNKPVSANNANVMSTVRPYDKDRSNVFNKEYSRYNAAKMADSKTNKSVSLITEKSKNSVGISSPSNEIRTKSGPPSTSSQPSQTQSPAALPPNPQMSPYLFQSVPQFPPGPIHFPGGQYVPIPAPQQLNSSMPFHFPQYPYATAPAYLPSAPPPPTAHSQYHMPPVSSSPYQPYMQPVAMAPFFSSQPPFSQQFYQPSHLQPTWSHLQPSFHISGSPQQSAAGGGGGGGAVGNVGVGGKTDLNSSGMSKYK